MLLFKQVTTEEEFETALAQAQENTQRHAVPACTLSYA